MKVSNMTGRSGREIPNQFIIIGDNGEYFQSYQSIIAYKEWGTGTITLDIKDWNYSRTTSKYRCIFLNESTKETQAKIDSGEYKLADLNK